MFSSNILFLHRLLAKANDIYMNITNCSQGCYNNSLTGCQKDHVRNEVISLMFSMKKFSYWGGLGN